MDLNLDGKRALVCGSSQGLGLASAHALAKLGAGITLVARREAELHDACRSLPEASMKHNYFVADFNKPEELEATAGKFVEDSIEPYSILINNSGGPPAGPLLDAEPGELLRPFQRHILASSILTRLLIAGMKQSDYGRIVNIVSTSVKEPLRDLGVSNTIRGAMGNWAKSMAEELGPSGITVNNILPGSTEGDRIDELIKARSLKSQETEAEVRTQMQRDIPLRRFAQAQEIGNAVAFLCSPAAAYINGINLPVDGGKTRSL